MKKGSILKYQWPSIPNVVSIATTELIKNILKENPLVEISEKLDGSNICISSNGWVASRRNIIIENFQLEDLTKIKLNGSSLEGLKCNRASIRVIHGKIQELIPDLKVQILVYGEWLQHRTATTQEDIYHYKDRGFKDEAFYGFGLSLIFDDNLDDDKYDYIQGKLKDQVGNNIIEKPEPYIITYGLGFELSNLFRDCGIATAPVIIKCPIRTALKEHNLIHHLIKRHYEGFIIVSKGFILKWKPVESEDKTFHIEAISKLKNELDDALIEEIIGELEKVCLSEAKKSQQPKKKIKSQLYMKLFRSAETKFQRIEDLLDESMTGEEKGDIQEKYQARIKQEIKEDIVKYGYPLDDKLDIEIDTLVKSVLDKRIGNWFKRLQRKT